MGKEQEPYLYDVQVGDKLYNFLEDNEEYVVVHISEEYEEIKALFERHQNLEKESVSYTHLTLPTN